MMKKKLVVFISISCVLALLISGGVYATSKWNLHEFAQATNEVAQENKASSAEANIAVVNGEEIKRSSFESYKVGLAQTGNEFTDQEIINRLVQRTVIMQEAEKRGYTVTDDEVEVFVEETMTLVYENPEILAIINQFIQDAGITMEDYKDRCREIGRETLLGNKLRNDMQAEFNSDERSIEAKQESFDEYFSQYINQLCESADVEMTS